MSASGLECVVPRELGVTFIGPTNGRQEDKILM